MLNRDFTKSNKYYFNKNKFYIVGLAVLLILGLIFGAIFGMRANFEIAGYNEFSVSISNENRSEINKYSKDIKSIIDNYNGKYDSYSVFDEGDNTKLIIRYMSSLSDDNIERVDNAIVEKLSITNEDISSHEKVGSVVKAKDYIYTAMVIVLLIVISSIFAYFRYNGASAMALILGTVLGSLSFMSIGVLLRLTVGMSYFAMLVILNLLIVYTSVMIFEKIRGESWLASKNFASAIESAIKKSKFRIMFIAIATLIIGVVFVLFAPAPIKYVSLNILFISVAYLFSVMYVIPFVWSACITKTNLKKKTEKA